MDKCKTCAHNDDFMICDCCIHAPELEDKFKLMTNAEKIRKMTDEELANELRDLVLGWAEWCPNCKNWGEDGCDKCIEKWLKRPAKEV